MCVSRSIFLLARLECSPCPASVGRYTLFPSAMSKSSTCFQSQPPPHAPCTRTQVNFWLTDAEALFVSAARASNATRHVRLSAARSFVKKCLCMLLEGFQSDVCLKTALIQGYYQERCAGERHGDKTSWTARGQDIADTLR